jgi:DNA-directed RNA polymerase subunit RPC12/RpoP
VTWLRHLLSENLYEGKPRGAYMTDAKKRTTSVTMETGPVICGRCNRELLPLMNEELAGFLQLRAGSILISNIEGNCSHCGWKFIWKIREKDVENMILKYQQLIDLYQRE